MTRKRIDFDNDGSRFSQLLNLAAEYQRAMANGETAKAAGAMLRAERCAERLTDEALVEADATMSRRAVAEEMGMGLAHGTITHRINRINRDAAEIQD